MLLSLWLFGDQFQHIVAVSFTALIINELLMVAYEIHTWHIIMIYAEAVTLAIYIASMLLLPTYFGARSHAFLCLSNARRHALFGLVVVRGQGHTAAARELRATFCLPLYFAPV